MAEPRRSARAPADAPWRQRFARAPPLFHDIRYKAQASHVQGAISVLRGATDECVAELAASDIGVIADVIRAASTKGNDGSNSAFIFVEVALRRGLPPDTRSPGFAAWEQLSVPLVSAAQYGYVAVIRKLLENGANPAAVDAPDCDNALHAAIEKPTTIKFLLCNTWMVAGPVATNPHRAEFIRLVNSPNRYGKTPFIAALVADPQKAAHKQSAVDLARHAVLSDDDFLILHTQRKLARLQAVILDRTTVPPSQVPVARTRFWQPAWHWTFPASDRAVLNLLHAFSFRADSESPLPPELWAHVFSFVERGHFELIGEESDFARLAAASERAEAVAAAEMPAAAAAASSSAAVALQ